MCGSWDHVGCVSEVVAFHMLGEILFSQCWVGSMPCW